MVGIKYNNDGEDISIINDIEYQMPHSPAIFKNISNDTLLIATTNSFGYWFKEFKNIEKFCEIINEYELKYNKINKILIDFNETIVDESGINSFANIINKKCYYSNFDMINSNSVNKLYIPSSLYSQIDFLLSFGYLNAKYFLEKINTLYNEFKKPHKLVFYSSHISPIRIDIFNILKETNNLKNNICSFDIIKEYYSDKKHNLDEFFKENEGIIPFSYDKYNRQTTHFCFNISQFLAYFEIITESYFFNDIENINNHCPVTEKILKPIVLFLPFIYFGSSNLKKCLEEIGMTFNSPLYGFYDITNEEDTQKGLEHVKKYSEKTIDELHEIYYTYLQEYHNNAEKFLNYFNNNTNNILNTLNINF
jgi:hypothetical protein